MHRVLKITSTVIRKDFLQYRNCVKYEERNCDMSQRLQFISRDTNINHVYCAAKAQPSVYFKGVFADLLKDVTEYTAVEEAPELADWIEQVLKYNCSGGKMFRGIATLQAHEYLEDPSKINSHSRRMAAIMGWCIELLQASLLMMDDVMDGSEYRRGVPCWYRQKSVGLSAFNDALLVQGCLHALLRKYFHDEPYYADVLDTFNQIQLNTVLGQCLDWKTSQNGRANLNLFTIERYNSIVKYKTAFYTFLLPIKLALIMAGKVTPADHKSIENICFKIGHFYQVQDDYLDSFGSYEQMGKDCTDIKEGKCSWPAVVAMQISNEDQRNLMETFYGSEDPKHVEIIRGLYRELNIEQIYLAVEHENYKSIRADIDKLVSDLPIAFFIELIDTIYKRRC